MHRPLVFSDVGWHMTWIVLYAYTQRRAESRVWRVNA